MRGLPQGRAQQSNDRPRLAAPDRSARVPLHWRELRNHPPLLRGTVAMRARTFLPPRRHDFDVFCFAERAYAEQFRERFGGEFIDPKDRPKWPGSRR